MVEPTNEVRWDTTTKMGRSGKQPNGEKEGKGNMTREEDEGGNGTMEEEGEEGK